jgi:type II secretory pathway component PulJ
MRKKVTTYHLPPTTYFSRRGFSILELLVFTAIFAIVIVSFISILVSITRVQSRQGAVAQVNGESQFLLTQIEYYVEHSSLIDMSQDSQTSTLKLWTGADANDPTYIYLSAGTVYLKQTNGGTPQALTTSRVNVTSLAFTKHSNTPSHDSVSVSFSMVNNSPNMTQYFGQSLQFAIARVSAATFDSNVVPSSTAGAYSLGTVGQYWNPINGIINFVGTKVYFTGNVGVNMASQPTQAFQVAGGDVYISGTGCSGTGCGLILKAINGTTCARIILTNGGQISTSSAACT